MATNGRPAQCSIHSGHKLHATMPATTHSKHILTCAETTRPIPWAGDRGAAGASVYHACVDEQEPGWRHVQGRKINNQTTHCWDTSPTLVLEPPAQGTCRIELCNAPIQVLTAATPPNSATTCSISRTPITRQLCFRLSSRPSTCATTQMHPSRLSQILHCTIHACVHPLLSVLTNHCTLLILCVDSGDIWSLTVHGFGITCMYTVLFQQKNSTDPTTATYNFLPAVESDLPWMRTCHGRCHLLPQAIVGKAGFPSTFCQALQLIVKSRK